MSDLFPILTSPGKIGTLELKNRIVLPPMGTDAGRDGFVTDAIVNRYAENAKGGTGLIITEVTCVDPPLGINTAQYIALSDDKYIPGFPGSPTLFISMVPSARSSSAMPDAAPIWMYCTS